ncbi:MAG: hypothetical protein IJM92_15840 [Fibrobacter sp.]|uniref:hypothetical protein n=1 Tax=Fibrobacter sp. TaxID=35828 RepID=UPI0025BE9F72|nr:hypothetical protein [Fibrobacter sp.]MBQ7081095.1 hypothetical protein [Fibrobacter sp.]
MPAKTIDEYFESIKHNKAKLRQFIADMPKGADLHNHLTGAVYAETLFASVIAKNQEIAKKQKQVEPEQLKKMFWVNLKTGKLSKGKPDSKKDSDYDADDADDYVCLIDKETLFDGNNYKNYNFHVTRMTLIDEWSVRDFQPYKYPLGPDEYFFSLFGSFGAATACDYLPDFAHELKVRAKEENVQYIETMSISPSIPAGAFLSIADYNRMTEKLDNYCRDYKNDPIKSEENIRILIKEIIDEYERQYSKKLDIFGKVDDYITENCDILKKAESRQDFLTSRFDTSAVSESDVMMKFQGYASRNSEPLVVLAQLYIVHKAMQERPDLIVGCNIVAAENSENSMRYYMAHMIMFSELGEKFFNAVGKRPNTSLHAGELTMGLIRPEHLTYHIKGAVMTAGAKRIGHGVDIVFEHDSAYLMKVMRENHIAVEINLTSNEFILGVKGDTHPFALYKDNGVPVVISTDDPGILRTSITEEFTHAVYRYDLSYSELKSIVSNSIEYSFLNDDDKKKVRDAYNDKLVKFEGVINDIIDGVL